MLTKKEIEEKYWLNFTFDKDIEFIPRLYSKKNVNEIDKNKILHIKPFTMDKYGEFFSAIKSMQYDKNSIPDKKIIKMSYLDYILYLHEKDLNNEFKEEDDRYGVMYKFLYILSNALGIDIHTIIPSIDDKGKKIILLNFKHRFVKVDRFTNGAFLVVNNIMGKNQIHIKNVNDINELYGYEKVKLFDYVIDSPIEEDIIVLTSKDIDFLKQIICYQNIIHYDDSYIDPYIKKDIEKYKKITNKENNEISLKRQILNVMLNYNQFKSVSDIEKIPIRTFFEMTCFIDDREKYKAQLSGMVTFENPVNHYLVDYVNIYENMVNKDSMNEKIRNK